MFGRYAAHSMHRIYRYAALNKPPSVASHSIVSQSETTHQWYNVLHGIQLVVDLRLAMREHSQQLSPQSAQLDAPILQQ